jgi:hypothetical protein
MGYEFWKPPKVRFEGLGSAGALSPGELEGKVASVRKFLVKKQTLGVSGNCACTGQAACAGYNVALYSTGLSSNPAISDPRMQAYLESGISQNELNSLRRPNEKVGMAVRSSCTHLGGGSADCLVPGFAG